MSRGDREQLAGWFPAGTKERLKQLAQPGETRVAVLLRGLAALENPPGEIAPEANPSRVDELATLRERLERIEAMLDTSSHASSQGAGYDREAVRARVLALQAEGIGAVAMAERLTAEGWQTAKGGPWRESSIRTLLRG